MENQTEIQQMEKAMVTSISVYIYVYVYVYVYVYGWWLESACCVLGHFST